MEQPAPTVCCPFCNSENDPAAAVCQGCEASLTVSLAVTRAVDPEAAAAVAALLAGEALERVPRLEARLIAGRGVLVKALSASEAQWYLEQARQLGVTLEVRRWRLLARPRAVVPSSSWRRVPTAGTILIGLLFLVVISGVYLFRLITAPPPDAGIGWRSATIKPGRIVARGDASSRPIRPPPPVDGLELSPGVIADVGRAVVRVTVPDGVGTGFFVSSSGLLVTSYHVIARGGPVRVTAGGVTAMARAVRLAPAWDLALLQVDLKPERTLELADGALAAPATRVFTVGSAEGLDHSARDGSISYVGRALDGVSLLELDVAATQGNSGGPVVDYSGRVVGVLNATLSSSARTSFAVMSNYLFDGADALLRGMLPVYPVSEPFLKLQLKSLADVGARVLHNRTVTASQAFITGSGYLGGLAEGSRAPIVTHGEPVLTDLRVRDSAGKVLLERTVQAATTDHASGDGAADGSSTAVYFYVPLSPEEQAAIRQAKGVKLEVRCDALQIHKLLELAP